MKLLLPLVLLFVTASLSAKDLDAIALGERLILEQIQQPLSREQRTVEMFSRRRMVPAQLTWRGQVTPEIQSFEVTTMEGMVIIGLFNTKDKTLQAYDTMKKQFVAPAEHTRLKSAELLKEPGAQG